MWNGVALTKNALGQLCLMTVISLVWATAMRWSNGQPIPRKLLLADGFVVLLAVYLMVGAPSGDSSPSVVIQQTNNFYNADPSSEARLRLEIQQSGNMAVQQAVQAVAKVSGNSPSYRQPFK